MVRDWMRNRALGIPALLEDGIRLLIYAGEEDLICNWPGNSSWVNALAWSGKKKATGEAPTVPFVVEGKRAGQLKVLTVVTPDTQPIYHQIQTAMSNGLEYVCPDCGERIQQQNK
ncbi:hypothetical protein NC651_021607 [Populus alba x Populus x berolinensis]|nr:hypothetical protein NC651_021607 [Populus alba x Populus x berolinensis]